MGADRSIFDQFFPVVGRDPTLKFPTIRSLYIVYNAPKLFNFNIEGDISFIASKKIHGLLRIHSPPKGAPALCQKQSSPVHLYTVPATPVRQAEADEPRNKPGRINQTRSLITFLSCCLWGTKQTTQAPLYIIFALFFSFFCKWWKVKDTRPCHLFLKKK